MTKDDLVLLIHERTGFSKVESAEILEEILNLLKDSLAAAEATIPAEILKKVNEISREIRYPMG